ncbi:hypothetical protein LCGC14_1373870 [marine sediment metagenome]|uniref:Uncharacterized protein n=1 Tax=marine sediment metagenome TaxID=412755 RepID=A0A0F9MJU6_9ZZZZ
MREAIEQRGVRMPRVPTSRASSVQDPISMEAFGHAFALMSATGQGLGLTESWRNRQSPPATGKTIGPVLITVSA